MAKVLSAKYPSKHPTESIKALTDDIVL